MVGPLPALASLVRAPLQMVLLADNEKAVPLWMRLDPVTRAKVSMALLGMVLVGVALVALAWIGGRRLRRIAAKPSHPTRRQDDDWSRKPLNPDAPPPPRASDPQ